MDAKRSNGQVMVINGNENLSVLRPLRKSGSQYAKQWRCKREVCVPVSEFGFPSKEELKKTNKN